MFIVTDLASLSQTKYLLETNNNPKFQNLNPNSNQSLKLR